jgi:hypothetical protein
MQIEKPSSSTAKQIKYDNLYDLIYSEGSVPKLSANLCKSISLGDSKSNLNFLEQSNQIIKDGGNQEICDMSKVKINKQFKLISGLPKLQSVPATP